MYHMIEPHRPDHQLNAYRVSPDTFELHLKWITKNNWTTYTISEYQILNKKPKKSLCLTFDDGFGSLFTNAFPLLKKYNCKATIYLVPDRQTNVWDLGIEKDGTSLLTKEQIQELSHSGLVEFGSHTATHADLKQADIHRIKHELMASKKKIENLVNQPCRSFAYPYGRFTKQSISWVKEAAYKTAVTTRPGIADFNNPYQLNRINMHGFDTFFDFYLRLTRGKNKL